VILVERNISLVWVTEKKWMGLYIKWGFSLKSGASIEFIRWIQVPFHQVKFDVVLPLNHVIMVSNLRVCNQKRKKKKKKKLSS